MNVPDIFLRSFLAGCAMGIPAYIIGTMHYNGRRFSKFVLRSVGAFVGLLGGLAFVGAVIWPVVLIMGLITTLSGAFWFGAMPDMQDALRRRLGK